MKDALTAILILILLGLLTRLLLFLKKPLKRLALAYIEWRIMRSVKAAEKKFPAPGSGTQKKDWVLQKTQKYEARLLTMNKAIDTGIEQAVAILNARAKITNRALQTEAANALQDGLEKAADILNKQK